MDDPHLRNPAGRLYLLLQHMDAASGNSSSAKHFAGYVDLAGTTGPDYFTALAEVLKLPGLFAEAVDQLVSPPIPKEDLLDELPKITQSLAQIAAGGSNGHVQANHDAGTMKSLAHASHILNNSRGTLSADISESLSEMRRLADELLLLVVDDVELNSQLRRLLMDHLSHLIRSVDLFKVAGIDAVLAETDRFIGNIHRETEIYSSGQKRTKFWSKFEVFVRRIILVNQTLHTPVAIAGDVNAVLELTQTIVSP